MMRCPHCSEVIRTIDIEFDFTAGTVKSGGREVQLGPKQMHTLECLIDAYPGGASTVYIANEVYSDADHQNRFGTVRANINVLREKFEAARLPWTIGRIGLGKSEGRSAYVLLPNDVVEEIRQAS
jgi:DNA-binding response OmpR family regulator